MTYFRQDTRSALEAKQQAQHIAFGPIVFQASKALRDLGVLAAIDDAGTVGLNLPEISTTTGLSRYAARVLAEAGLGIGLLVWDACRFRLTKLGWHVLHDPMTRVNMDFVHDVNYKSFFHLQDALTDGRPAGPVTRHDSQECRTAALCRRP